MDDSSAVITITVVLLSNVSAHSPISEWLQLIDYKDSLSFSCGNWIEEKIFIQMWYVG